MSYNPLIPQVANQTLQSYYQLRANFQSIAQAFGDNHVGLTQDDSVSGMHNLLNFQPQTGMTPDPATSATQIALYTKLVNSIPELFYRPSSDQNPIQMTYPSINADSSDTQYSFVAGPFVIYGGFISAPTNGQTVTLLPSTTLVYIDIIAANLQVVAGIKTQVVIPTSVVGNSFNISFEGTRKFDVFYLAVGV